MHRGENIWGFDHKHEAPSRICASSQSLLNALEREQIRKATTAKTAAWLDDIFKDDHAVNDQNADTSLQQRNRLIENSAQEWLNLFFTQFEVQSKEFNESKFGFDFKVMLDKPKASFKLLDRRDPSVKQYEFTCYQGHLTTHSWSLLLRSYFNTLQVFIVPQEMLLGLELNSISEFPPLIQLKAAVNGDNVTWALLDQVLSREMLPAIARELFADLVKAERGEIDQSDLFGA